MPAKTPLFQLDRPLAGADLATYKDELANLQGNILKSHGRESAVHVFLTFKPGEQAAAKAFVRKFAKRLTSARAQQKQTADFKKTKKSQLFVGMALSATGYGYLGQAVAGFSPEFRHGMKAAGARLDDPPPAQWDDKFRGDVHALIVLAHDRISDLTAELGRLRTEVEEFAESSSEFGIGMKNPDGNTIEHFGYVDGRSQPLFFKSDLKDKTTNWNPLAGPSLVLVKDPLGKNDRAIGSYFVFRKLEQDVKGFKTREQDLATALGLVGEDRELAGALVVGRFEDGTPVVLSKTALGKATPANDFAYPTADPNGNKCPFAGHIRKANPRGDTGSLGATLPAEKNHRIARRGITFGDPTPPGEDLDQLPSNGVGLLFQCCQADLANQFEFIQQTWVDGEGFLRQGTGRDPVIGQKRGGAFPDNPYPRPWGAAGRTSFGFHGFVTLKGGEYFFVPSISFLKGLA